MFIVAPIGQKEDWQRLCFAYSWQADDVSTDTRCGDPVWGLGKPESTLGGLQQCDKTIELVAGRSPTFILVACQNAK